MSLLTGRIDIPAVYRSRQVEVAQASACTPGFSRRCYPRATILSPPQPRWPPAPASHIAFFSSSIPSAGNAEDLHKRQFPLLGDLLQRFNPCRILRRVHFWWPPRSSVSRPSLPEDLFKASPITISKSETGSRPDPSDTSHKVHQRQRPLHMPQKLNPEPVAFVRTFNQPRNIGHHERSRCRKILARILTTPKFGLERSERIIGKS